MKLRSTQKLFNAIVVLGVATALNYCSNSNPSPGDDASSDGSGMADNSNVMDTGSPDVAPDTGSGNKDSGGDAFTGWMGC